MYFQFHLSIFFILLIETYLLALLSHCARESQQESDKLCILLYINRRAVNSVSATFMRVEERSQESAKPPSHITHKIEEYNQSCVTHHIRKSAARKRATASCHHIHSYSPRQHTHSFSPRKHTYSYSHSLSPHTSPQAHATIVLREQESERVLEVIGSIRRRLLRV